MVRGALETIPRGTSTYVPMTFDTTEEEGPLLTSEVAPTRVLRGASPPPIVAPVVHGPCTVVSRDIAPRPG